MIPPFQELMLPILEMYAARDTESIANREFMETLATRFHLTEADLMIEHGIGVTKEHAYIVKKIDSDYFDEG